MTQVFVQHTHHSIMIMKFVMAVMMRTNQLAKVFDNKVNQFNIFVLKFF